jgi:hypothetical protein
MAYYSRYVTGMKKVACGVSLLYSGCHSRNLFKWVSNSNLNSNWIFLLRPNYHW